MQTGLIYSCVEDIVDGRTLSGRVIEVRRGRAECHALAI